MHRSAPATFLAALLAISYGCAAKPMVDKTIPAGTGLSVELLDSVSSAESSPGDTFQARVNKDIVVGGAVVVPAGATVIGTVTEARGLKKIGGKAILRLEFNTVELPTGEAPIQAAYYREGRSETKRDAATIGGAAAGGALLGRILDNDHDGKSTAVGAVVGGAAGTAIAAGTKGEEINLPSGTQLTLHLRAPVTVKVEA